MQQIKIDDEVIYELSEIQIKCIESAVPCAKEWLKNGPLNFINSKSDRMQDDLILKWWDILSQENETLPSDKDLICQMIFADPRYLSCKDRYLQGIQ